MRRYKMAGMGTLVNMAAILIGSTVGLLFRSILKQRFKDTIMHALGLAVMFIGISGALQGLLKIEKGSIETTNVIFMVVCLALGAFLGELLDIEARLERFGEYMKKTLKVKGEKGQNFVEGFVSSSLLYCIGAMAIIGALNDGLKGEASTLYAKAIIDGTVSVFIASTLGIGVFFSVIPLGIYQGFITFAAKYVEPLLSDGLILNVSFIGSIIIFGLGINMIFGKKIKCGNLLPAVLIPIIYELIKWLFK
jgi:uncharacterized membrane protein YqgA involved in biofilm formation